MRRALELARASDGSVAPRPPVGAVVVTPDGEIAGEGRTLRKPGPHAEAAALEAAGDAARGATVYVTLEPCTIATSKPASCADLLIEAGVARVVAAITDPCPDVDGRGFAALRAAGIEVSTGLFADEATELIAPFARWITTDRRPFVTLKLAASLDGKVAAPDGTSRWITGEAARAEVHDLRRRVDAIVVGSGTVLADDPELTHRMGAEGDQPLRVVFDSNGRTPSSARMFPGLLVTADDIEVAVEGADIVAVPRAEGGVDVPAALGALGERGLCHVLLEGGPTLAASFLQAGEVDRLILYLAPIVIGGEAPGLFATGAKTLTDAYGFEITGTSRVGDDLRIDARSKERG